MKFENIELSRKMDLRPNIEGLIMNRKNAHKDMLDRPLGSIMS